MCGYHGDPAALVRLALFFIFDPTLQLYWHVSRLSALRSSGTGRETWSQSSGSWSTTCWPPSCCSASVPTCTSSTSGKDGARRRKNDTTKNLTLQRTLGPKTTENLFPAGGNMQTHHRSKVWMNVKTNVGPEGSVGTRDQTDHPFLCTVKLK